MGVLPICKCAIPSAPLIYIPFYVLCSVSMSMFVVVTVQFDRVVNPFTAGKCASLHYILQLPISGMTAETSRPSLKSVPARRSCQTQLNLTSQFYSGNSWAKKEKSFFVHSLFKNFGFILLFMAKYPRTCFCIPLR